MKGLKITNIILFSLICLSEIFASIFYIQAIISINSTKVGGALAILALLPLFIIFIAIILILNIILTLTNKSLNKKLQIINEQPHKLSKIFTIISWCLFLINVISLVIFILIN